MELLEESYAETALSLPEPGHAFDRASVDVEVSRVRHIGIEPRDLAARIPVANTEDIVRARQTGRFLVHKLGFSDNQSTIVATVISELARNIVLYAKAGAITVCAKLNGTRLGVAVEAIDAGPGIVNLQSAMESGFSTSGGLGFGLSGVRDMADEFYIRSHAGHGTMVVATIWMK